MGLTHRHCLTISFSLLDEVATTGRLPFDDDDEDDDDADEDAMAALGDADSVLPRDRLLLREEAADITQAHANANWK